MEMGRGTAFTDPDRTVNVDLPSTPLGEPEHVRSSLGQPSSKRRGVRDKTK